MTRVAAACAAPLPEDRALIDRAVAAAGTNVTAFVLSSVTTAARQVLADRTEFVLSPEAAEAWEAINERPARNLPTLRELIQWPSPFIRECLPATCDFPGAKPTPEPCGTSGKLGPPQGLLGMCALDTVSSHARDVQAS
ncbi:MAG: DUF1778 domain-containing protein [Spirochaetaceae bacterium]|nr:DUF1778 domain-containing protein [Spirochaetaceae bacterium]